MPNLLNGSQTPYPPELQYSAYDSPDHPDLVSQHYPPYDTLQSGTRITSYPESSQRTHASSTGNPYPPSYDTVGNDQFNNTERHDALHRAHAESDLNQMRSMMSPSIHQQPPPFQPDRYIHRGGLLDNDASSCHPGPNQFSYYCRDPPEQLHPLPLLLRRNPSPETTNLQGQFDSSCQSDSGGGADASYASLGRHGLANPLHSPFQSSIPMCNDAGWSSASPPGAYDHAQPSVNGSSNVVHDSDSPASFGLPELMDVDPDTATVLSSSELSASYPPIKKKKTKMHECEVCGKMFPRPSGLKTHMNTHNNLKPFPCGFSGCPRTFTVRSNAKRHLRTHGVDTSVSRGAAEAPYVVGFSTPTVMSPAASGMHEMNEVPLKLRWMPPSLSSRTNVQSLTSLSDDDSESDDGQEEVEGTERSALSLPFHPVIPSSSAHDPHEPFEERNSYVDALLYPYHPSQFRFLPGPSVASPQPNSAE